MTTSPDTPESADLPSPQRGPMALILGALRTPANLAVTRLKQLAAAGALSSEQVELYHDVMRSLQHITRTIEQYAPPQERATVRAARSERWDAGEQPDAVDDRYQDAPLPLDDRPGRDEQP